MPKQPAHAWLKSYHRLLTLLLCAGILLSAIATLSVANATQSSDKKTLLTVYGNISNASDGPLEIDYQTLAELESTSFTSTAPWLDGPVEFKGVRVSTFLKHIGAKSNQFEAIALNDYRFTLSEIDFDKYPIIIAYEKDKKQLSVRTQGPLLIMFPFDDYPELLTEKNKAASVWQLLEINIL